MTPLIFECASLEETRALGIRLGHALGPGIVIALNGTLGSGKTNLTQAIAAGLDIDASTVVSPTFTLCVPHQGRHPLLHLDAYRINALEEVDELALDESVEDGSILIVEWAEKIVAALPAVDLEIRAVHSGEDSRQYTLIGHSERGRGLVAGLR